MIENQGAFEAGTANVGPTTYSLETSSPTQRRALYDQYIWEERQRQEQEYIDELKAKGEPIYDATEVAKRFGIQVDPTWVQKDLQRLMAVGDIYYPITGLREKASTVHKLYVGRGRVAMRAILQEAYAFYVKARNSKHCGRIVSELAGTFVEKKHRKNTNDASVFIRSVFADYNDKQVHVYGKSLEYCYFKNVAVVDFDEFVKENGGFDGVRLLAMQELPRTPEQQAESNKRKAEQDRKVKTLSRWWEVKRSTATQRVPLPDALKRDLENGEDLVLRAVVQDGELRVYWTSSDPAGVILKAFDEAMVDSLGYEAKKHGSDDVYQYMSSQLEYMSNPPPAVAAFRELEAKRLSEMNLGDAIPSIDELAESR